MKMAATSMSWCPWFHCNNISEYKGSSDQPFKLDYRVQVPAGIPNKASLSEWLKLAACKAAALRGYGGSNPSRRTNLPKENHMQAVIQGLKALFVQPTPAPTVDSVMSSFNKAISDLEQVNIAAQADVELFERQIHSAIMAREYAHNEGSRALAVQAKLVAIIS